MNIKLTEKSGGQAVHIVWGPMAIIFVLAAGILKPLAGLIPSCVFHRITGFPCLTCGGTRSILALSQFDPGMSFLHNPLVTLFIAGLILFSILSLLSQVTGRSVKIELAGREKRGLRILIILAVSSNWIYLILAGK